MTVVVLKLEGQPTGKDLAEVLDAMGLAATADALLGLKHPDGHAAIANVGAPFDETRVVQALSGQASRNLSDLREYVDVLIREVLTDEQLLDVWEMIGSALRKRVTPPTAS
jgi:hypothetical protein